MTDIGSLKTQFKAIKTAFHPLGPTIGFISRIEIVDLINIAEQLFRRIDDLQTHNQILEEQLEQEKHNHSQFGMGG